MYPGPHQSIGLVKSLKKYSILVFLNVFELRDMSGNEETFGELKRNVVAEVRSFFQMKIMLEFSEWDLTDWIYKKSRPKEIQISGDLEIQTTRYNFFFNWLCMNTLYFSLGDIFCTTLCCFESLTFFILKSLWYPTQSQKCKFRPFL